VNVVRLRQVFMTRFSQKTIKYYGLDRPRPVHRRYNPLILARNNYDADVEYKYVDGVCTGYSVHPKLYDGRPPKGVSISNPQYLSARARRRHRKKRTGLHHTADVVDWPESTISVEELLLSLRKPDLEQAPPELPPRRPPRPPPRETVQASQDDYSMRRELALIAGTRTQVDPLPAIMSPPYADKRIMRLTPNVSEFSDSRQIIPIFSPDEERGATIYLCKLVDIIMSNELVSIPIPSPTYLQDRTVNDVWLPPIIDGTPADIRKERSKLIAPLFAVNRDIRSKAYFEMCYDLISRNYDAIRRGSDEGLNLSTWSPWQFMEL